VAIKGTNFELPGQVSFYKGKVRDVYNIDNKLLVMVATDRISAFDVVLPKPIPYKGQVLNQLAAKFLAATQDILPNWIISVPNENVSIGRICVPFKVEMVIRGYLVGHAWRTYKSGERMLCGVKMPDGMVENQAFEKPIITPTTKAAEGHDEDISREEIIKQGIVSEADYIKIEAFTHKIYQRGQEMAAERGLILVDTKYEFGKIGDEIYLMDEIHTPDSSRYFYAESYMENLRNGKPQQQLSKEFVREWLIANNFMGKEGQTVPEMSEEWVNTISNKYIELYEKVCGEQFVKADQTEVEKRIERNILGAI
jgi:phosphoribosylaminoimidazole-succinocarboxamide synthase